MTKALDLSLAYKVADMALADFLQHHDETMRSRYGDRWLGFDEERLQERLRQAGFDVLSCTRQAVGRGLFLLLVRARAC